MDPTQALVKKLKGMRTDENNFEDQLAQINALAAARGVDLAYQEGDFMDLLDIAIVNAPGQLNERMKNRTRLILGLLRAGYAFELEEARISTLEVGSNPSAISILTALGYHHLEGGQVRTEDGNNLLHLLARGDPKKSPEHYIAAMNNILSFMFVESLSEHKECYYKKTMSNAQWFNEQRDEDGRNALSLLWSCDGAMGKFLDGSQKSMESEKAQRIIDSGLMVIWHMRRGGFDFMAQDHQGESALDHIGKILDKGYRAIRAVNEDDIDLVEEIKSMRQQQSLERSTGTARGKAHKSPRL